MGKSVSRVNGRKGESMWTDGDELSFRARGKVHRVSIADVRTIQLTNAEEARSSVCDTDLVPMGSWTDEMASSNGKCDYLMVTTDDQCWVMEVAKSQSPNALTFAQGVKPKEKPTADDFKLYAAIQTPLGGVLALGSIVCVLLAFYFTFSMRIALLGIGFGIAAIVMFANVR